MEYAPYYAEICEGPENGTAYWITTSDGVRIRTGVWPSAPAQAKGTVFILPGRTEYVEKYGRSAVEFAKRGYATLAIDWRGQGIADRLLEDRAIGHVNDFADYQLDLDAVYALAQELDLPKPWFMMAHSMGGAIGLRALSADTPFKAAAFSAPMWGIGLTNTQKLMIRMIAPILQKLGKHKSFAPGTKPVTYVLAQKFEDNTLTSDANMYAYMKRQLTAEPDLAIGGPSTQWVLQAIQETSQLMQAPAPHTPMLCALGLDEKIVDTQAIRTYAAHWPHGTLVEFPGARHEIPIETPQTRDAFFDQACTLFDTHC